MAIDYDAASRTYDNTRHSQAELIERWAARVNFTPGLRVLDFGCGTGSYLAALRAAYGCRCFGVEPAAGMRAQAHAKDAALTIRAGDHTAIPYEAASFDFVFMTDVVHHIPDLGLMFAELGRVLAPAGQLCIVTEAHAQVAARFYNRYFPSLVANETDRYPDLATISAAGQAVGLAHDLTEILPLRRPRCIDATFLRNVAEKNYSMFRLLNDAEYQQGLERLRRDAGRCFEPGGAGQTLLWFRGAPPT